MKAVIGADYGLGEGILIKNENDGLYYPSPSEGGQADFAARTKEDWDLITFAKFYLQSSNNIENR